MGIKTARVHHLRRDNGATSNGVRVGHVAERLCHCAQNLLNPTRPERRSGLAPKRRAFYSSRVFVGGNRRTDSDD
jgi:hypothetical protein